jgi:anti-anti-sigma factor
MTVLRSAATMARRVGMTPNLARGGAVSEHRRFRVDTQIDDDVLRIRPRGELDLATAPLLERELIRSEGTSVSAIDLDLTDITFMDAFGIRSLLRAAARTRADSNRLRITGATGQVSRLIALTEVEKWLPLGKRAGG